MRLFLLPLRYLARVLLVVIIIYPNEKHLAFVRIEGVEVFFALNLLQGIAGGRVVLELDDDGRMLAVQVDWHKDQIGETFARG